ncbi:hypothetical protein Vadar_008217 [Vaccinium darrowii]|uniref:Uncharacterized protein n=1 Tax=Vaccinium darrowii TaxID=229202 RepID=A0ACB7X8W6_9ERIC|nr:hypothetical protein Vadar_008217 [Vaccinium darrowii]
MGCDRWATTKLPKIRTMLNMLNVTINTRLPTIHDPNIPPHDQQAQDPQTHDQQACEPKADDHARRLQLRHAYNDLEDLTIYQGPREFFQNNNNYRMKIDLPSFNNDMLLYSVAAFHPKRFKNYGSYVEKIDKHLIVSVVLFQLAAKLAADFTFLPFPEKLARAVSKCLTCAQPTLSCFLSNSLCSSHKSARKGEIDQVVFTLFTEGKNLEWIRQ